MKIHKLLTLILYIYITHLPTIFCQNDNNIKSAISIKNDYLFLNMDNVIQIVALQNKPVSINQLKATMLFYDSIKVGLPIEIKGDNGIFTIRPEEIGIIELNITVGNTIETKLLRVKPVEAVGKLSNYGANYEGEIAKEEFKAQLGIFPVVECCGFDIKCQIQSYQMLKISHDNQSDRTYNNGGKFEDNTKKIIMKAESGDIYIFREIKYKCPGSLNSQRLDDMIFEIK